MLFREFNSQRDDAEEQVSQAIAMMREREKRAFLRMLEKGEKKQGESGDSSDDEGEAKASGGYDDDSDLSDGGDMSDSEEDDVSKQLKAGS
jgi:hypothetical protein